MLWTFEVEELDSVELLIKTEMLEDFNRFQNMSDGFTNPRDALIFAYFSWTILFGIHVGYATRTIFLIDNQVRF